MDKQRTTSLERRLAMMIGTLVVLIVGIAGATSWTTRVQKNDAEIINLAGRQRMLTQKFNKEFLSEITDPQQVAAESQADRTRQLFEGTLAALRQGGTTHRDLSMTQPVEIPANRDPEVEAQLAKVDRQWNALQAAVAATRARKSESGSSKFTKRIREIDKLGINCLTTMNAAVAMFQARSEARTALLMNIQYAGSLSWCSSSS